MSAQWEPPGQNPPVPRPPAPQPYNPQPYHQQQPQPAGHGWGKPESSGSVFRKLGRLASEAASVIGGSGKMRRDVDNLAAIRRPIAITRRIGVTSPVIDGGTSTVAALLATMLASQRGDRVVAVDVDPAGAELSRRLELNLGAGAIEGVSLIRSDPTVPALRSTLAATQSAGARDVALAVVDCPGTMFDEIATEMANTGHCTVLVVPSAPQAAGYCLRQLDALSPAGQDLLLGQGIVVIALVEDADEGTARWLGDAFRQRGLEPVVLPYDAHVAGAWPLHSSELQSETREAVLELAARVVATVTRAAS